MIQEPTAGIIIIGNEILSGATQEKNLSFLATRLGERGIRVREARIIEDLQNEIISVVQDFRQRFTHVFTTGGIGPTHDDITIESIARAFDRPLVQCPKILEKFRVFYTQERLNQARLKMTYLPEGGEFFDHPKYPLAGFRIENVFVLAGIPAIMQDGFDHAVSFLEGGAPVHTKSIFSDTPEGDWATELQEIQQVFPDVQIGSYPHSPGEPGATIVARSHDKEKLEGALSAIQRMLKA